MNLYIASKVNHCDKWQELRNNWKHDNIHVNSTWIDEIRETLLNDAHDKPHIYEAAWSKNFWEIAQCDVLMVVGEKQPEVTGHLRGALIEVGAALSLHKPVIAVYDCPDFGTWKYYQRVHPVDSLKAARELLVSWMAVGSL